MSSIEPIPAPPCVQCGERLLPGQLPVSHGRCHGSRDFDSDFERAASLGEYAGALRGVIHLLKYDKILPAALVLGGMLAEVIKQVASGDKDLLPLIVPVALHASERGEHGFNRAELIVRAAVRRLPQSFEIASGLLKRQRPTRSQVELTREERVVKLRDAFRVTNPERVKGRTVIVVDDVMSVGTTVFECARVLKKAGTERVWAATVARSLKSVVLPQPAECGKQEEYEAAEKAVSV